jgi:hypothetical protein
MKIKGQRCKLLGNPPKRKSGTGTGDQFDGCAAAVSPTTMEYHQIGSLISPGMKAEGEIRKDGAVWIHVYKRTFRGSDTFRYSSSHVFEDKKGTSEAQEAKDQTFLDRLIGG